MYFKVFVAKIILAVIVNKTFLDLFNNYYTINLDKNCKKKVFLGGKNDYLTSFTQITTLYINIEK